MSKRPRVVTRHPPTHFLVGIVLIAVAWPLAWFGPAPFAAYTFFPLWLGYVLTVDGITLRRSGTSLLARDGRRFALLFAFSVPLWWLFEFANRFLQNWRYELHRDYDPFAYAVLASLAFSTVMPAVFVTAEFYRSFAFLAPARRWIRIAPSRLGLATIAVLGLAMFISSLTFPDVAFPLVWIGIFLLFDAINALAGGTSIAGQLAGGRWDTMLVLFAAGLTCGFFWEMWNYWSLPRWSYDVPHVPQVRLFEMPLLGYGGYLPFALEIYAFYQFMQRFVVRQRDDFLRFDLADAAGGRYSDDPYDPAAKRR